LKNNQEFYLIYDSRSWIAQVEGKKYYLLNISEEQRAAEAISRILRYGTAEEEEEDEMDMDMDMDTETEVEDEGGEDTEDTTDVEI
jgi:hypothetical protein